VRLVGAIVWVLYLLSDIGWGLIVGWPAGSARGHARWLFVAVEGIFAVAVGDWAWLAWRRRLLGESESSAER
jgi:hypothetical protein